ATARLPQSREVRMGRGLTFLVGGDDFEVGNRLFEVNGVVADDETQIHRHHPAIVTGVSMPHAVEAEDDVSPVPQAGAGMNLFTGVSPVWQRNLSPLPFETQSGGVRPVL